MLPQLLSLLHRESPSHKPQAEAGDSQQELSAFMCDSKLSVSETTHTEFSRAIDALEEPKKRR